MHIFGYLFARTFSEKLIAFQKNTRRVYLSRAIKLLFIIPFEVALVILAIFRKNYPCDYLICTDIYDWLPNSMSKFNSAVITPYWMKNATVEKNFKPVPAAFVYCTVGLLPWRFAIIRDVVDKYLPKIAAPILGLFINKNATLIVHSDSLPFIRALIKSLKPKEVRTLCIQHGSFHETISAIFHETCGMYSEINVVRSEADKIIIKKRAIHNKMVVMPHLFHPTLGNCRPFNKRFNKVLFVGEGYHTLDRDIDLKIRTRYYEIWQEISSAGFDCVYRRHPSENRDRVVCPYDDVDSDSLGESIINSLAVIGYSSSVLIQSAAMGVMTFQIKINGEYFPGLNRHQEQIHCFENIEQFLNLVESQTPRNQSIFAEQKTAAICQFEGLLVL